MNRQNKTVFGIIAALLGIVLLALAFPRHSQDGSGTGAVEPKVATSYTFEAATNGHYGMLHWTVEGETVNGCYADVWPGDPNNDLVSLTWPFGGNQFGGTVELTDPLHNGSIDGTLSGDTLKLSSTFGPIRTVYWRATTEQQFWSHTLGTKPQGACE